MGSVGPIHTNSFHIISLIGQMSLSAAPPPPSPLDTQKIEVTSVHDQVFISPYN